MATKTSKTIPTPVQNEPVLYRKPEELTPYEGNARVHNERQMTALMTSIKQFGFTGVIITNEDGMVLAGHGRLEAAKRLGLKAVPVDFQHYASTQAEQADRIADNKLAELAEWDLPALKEELLELDTGALDMDITGFDAGAMETLMTQFHTPDFQPASVDEQGRLDQKKPVKCPKCGHEFTT